MKRVLRIAILLLSILLLILIVTYSVLYFMFDYNLLKAPSHPLSLSINVEGEIEEIIILSPENKTYNFNFTEDYILDLNVSANFNASNWRYDLWDLKNGIKVNDTIAFFPNTTFEAVRGSNKLVVYAEKLETGYVYSKNVTFYINVSNTAPIIEGLNDSIYVCERDSLSYWFWVIDNDEDELDVDIYPRDPFWIEPTRTRGNLISDIQLFSGGLNKGHVGGVNNGWNIFLRNISASDGILSDSKVINITVIEINNPPVIRNLRGGQVWTTGDNQTFYLQVRVDDTEDGNLTNGNLTLDLTFQNGEDLFDISNEGIINFTPSEVLNLSEVILPITYNLTLCVSDNGLRNPHSRIVEFCEQDGGIITICRDFSLTVTDENRAPTIVYYYPENLTISAPGTEQLYFNITKYDPDWTIPNAYWYVNDQFHEFDNGSWVDDFYYSFGCGIEGVGTVSVDITDGLLNDSLAWLINIGMVECPKIDTGGSGGSGGRGGIIELCSEKWVCGYWGVCQNAEKSLSGGLLTGADYRIILEQCGNLGFDKFTCGVQIKECKDLNGCNTTYRRPMDFQSCYYTENPSCYDGIKNCHSGGCEVLIDCGGPCSPCPTCSDGIKNQGEEGVDCGGPCPWKCEIEVPFYKKREFQIGFVLIFLLIIFLIIKLRNVIKYKNTLQQSGS